MRNEKGNGRKDIKKAMRREWRSGCGSGCGMRGGLGGYRRNARGSMEELKRKQSWYKERNARGRKRSGSMRGVYGFWGNFLSEERAVKRAREEKA